MRKVLQLSRSVGVLAWVLMVFAPFGARAQDAPKSAEAARRQAAIAEFTRKMKEANYPALFNQAAEEFKVPADILKGIAFAETRWEHLVWPPGETASPETGMPRPFGIMSLWDNDYFGHSLIEAAHLIGRDPEDLKKDPLQNMRGAAALLRKYYDENAKPEGTKEDDLESWRNAIRKYCGLPQSDLSARHALDIYAFINEGYHQYGIEWDAHPVNLEPIRDDTARIVAEEQARKQSAASAGTNNPPGPENLAPPSEPGQALSNSLAAMVVTQPKVPPAPVGSISRTPLFAAVGVGALVLILMVFVRKSR